MASGIIQNNEQKITSFLFKVNVYNLLNTYIYHPLPPTSFGVCYTVFRQTIALLAQNFTLFAMSQFAFSWNKKK
jgi:hypothetical protein